MTLETKAYVAVKDFITRERAMRERVFRNKPDLQRKKLAECGHALEALEILKSLSLTQSNLFNEAPK